MGTNEVDWMIRVKEWMDRLSKWMMLGSEVLSLDLENGA